MFEYGIGGLVGIFYMAWFGVGLGVSYAAHVCFLYTSVQDKVQHRFLSSCLCVERHLNPLNSFSLYQAT